MFRTLLTVLAASLVLARANAEPQKIQLVLDVSSYGYLPIKGVDYLIDQPSPGKEFEMTLERNDRKLPFGEIIPGWSGTKDVVLKEGYQLRVKARYLEGQASGDFKLDKLGLSLDVSYFYEKQMIGFQTATQWVAPKSKVKASVDLKDVAYFDLINKNNFELPAVTDGYGEGFRAWVAVRDGLQKRDKKECNFESLTEFLKPLARKENLMIPTVTVTAKVK
jgi:hypothetical protein